ncbi:MAG: PEP-CTERM sorting domain-containing protein [Verrucomicrobiae bacterium]|nr:PEP-CTERM sorting domain-containing protein [Verrucomicrobiae bacterium]
MRKYSLMVAISFACLLAMTSQAAYLTIADSVAEFSSTQGQDNWYYGYRLDDDGLLSGGGWGAFTHLSTYDSGNQRWQRSGSFGPPYLNLRAQHSHPDNDATSLSGSFEFSARRWVSEVSGEILITGTVRKTYIGDGSLGDSGDGFVLAIFKNGALYARVAGLTPLGNLDTGANIVTGGSAGAGWSYLTNMSVIVGDNIEFIHASFADITSDGAIFTGYILQAIPEPSTAFLLLVGGVALWWKRRLFVG